MNCHYEQLSYDARLQRIGEILSRGVTLTLIREREQAEKDQQSKAKMDKALDSISSDETMTNVFDYIVKSGSVSPSEICVHFSIPYRTVFRKLQYLLAIGLIEQKGNTKARRYLPTSEPNGRNRAGERKRKSVGVEAEREA